MKHFFPLVLTLCCLVFSFQSTAQGITSVSHTPNPANPGDVVTINIQGWLPNACWSVTNCYVSWCGNTVTLDLDFYYNPNQICSQAIVNFNRSVNIGALTAGLYTIEIVNFDTGDYFPPTYDCTFQVGTGAACSTPSVSNLSTTNVTCTTATLNCSVLASYCNYRYRPVGSNTWTPATRPPCSSGSSTPVNNLIPNTQYEFQCMVCCFHCIDFVCSPWSPSQYFTTCSGGSYTCASPCPVFCGNTYTGNNGTLGMNNYNSWSGAGVSFSNMYGPEVFYQITLNQPGSLNLSLNGLSADLDLILLSSCSSTSIVAASGNSNNTSENINISNLPAGTYKIVVDGWNYAVSNYTLSVICGPYTCPSPCPVSCGNTYTGNNASLGMNNNNTWSGAGVSFTNMYGPEVFYQITLAQAGPLSISLTGLSADLDLILLSSCSTSSIIAASGNSNASSEYINISNLQAGTYKIVVDGWNYAVSNYSLSVQCNCYCCPAPVLNQLSVSNLTATSVRLNCNYSGASSYNWAYRLVGSTNWISLGTTTVNYKDVYSLNPNCNYEFQCAVYCSGGWTGWSPCQYFTTTCSCPNHDEPCGAIQLTPSSNCNKTYSTNVGATTSVYPSAPTGCNTYGMKDVWFKVQIPSSGSVKISTFSGTLTDAVVSFYKGSCNNLIPSTPNCFDATNGDEMPDVTINSQPGTWWYIRIWGYSGTTGTFSICAQSSLNLGKGSTDENTIYDKGGSDERDSETGVNIPDKTNASITSESNQIDMQVFPNPALDQLTVSTQLIHDGNLSIQVLDLTGKTIQEIGLEVTAGDFSQPFDVSELPSGLYLVRLKIGEMETVKKFMKI